MTLEWEKPMVLGWWLLGCQSRIAQPTLPVPKHFKFWKQNLRSEYEWRRRCWENYNIFFSLRSSMATTLQLFCCTMASSSSWLLPMLGALVQVVQLGCWFCPQHWQAAFRLILFEPGLIPFKTNLQPSQSACQLMD